MKEKFPNLLSFESLELDLSRAKLVLGHDSSALLTSIKNEIPTYRFKETATFCIPEVPIISMFALENLPSLTFINTQFTTDQRDVHRVSKRLASILDK